MKDTSYQITDEQIEHIAKLARISLTPEEKKKFRKELSSILEYVEKLNDVDAPKEVTHTHTELSNVLRKDTVTPSLTQDQALANRKSYVHDGYFTIKSVIDHTKGHT